MKKVLKTIITVLAAVLCVFVLPCMVQATEIVDSGTCGYGVNWELDSEGVLTISGYGDMENYLGPWDVPWYSYKEEIKGLVIEEGVTGIGINCFSSCSNLTSVTIPNSITSLVESAFAYCTSLTSVTIPSSITIIEESAFSGCTGLTSVTIPSSVTTIERYAFSDCTGFTSFAIPNSVTDIGPCVFRGCSGLTSVTIGSGISYIPDAMFRYCTSLTSITIPGSVTGIGINAFNGCSSLAHVAYTGTQSQWYAMSIGSGNTYLSDAICHYETQFQYIDSCTEYGIYCPVCKIFILSTIKEGKTHSYTNGYDLSCNACDFVRTVTGISVTKLPKKLAYVLFEDVLDVTGGEILLTYDDSSTGTIAMTADMVTGFDNTMIGVQQLTVTYNGANTKFSVEVLAQIPDALQIQTLPNKLSYGIGDSLDLTGLTLKAFYGNEQATVTAADVTAVADLTSVGTQTVTVTFQGKTAEFSVYVHQRGIITVDSSLYPESAHNYDNEIDETKSLTIPGATNLVLTFNSSSETESDYDYLYILDGFGNQIGKYSGSLANIVVIVPGDTVQIRLTSDLYQVRYGYKFSSIQAEMMIHPEVAIEGYAATFGRPGLTNGAKCTICGEWVRQQKEIPQLVGYVDQWNMTLSDDLKVNFYLKITEEIINEATVKLKVNGQTQSFCGNDLTETADGKYLLSANISAAQMNDDIIIIISSGGSLTTSETYSVKRYATSILSNNSYQQYHALVKEMLNYGAMAQIYFDYNTENLVNVGITNTAKTSVPNSTEDLMIEGKSDSITFYGASLVFKDRIAVRYYFRYNGDLTQFEFSAEGIPLTFDIKDELLYVEVSDILPQELDRQINLTVEDADGNTIIVSYSPMNYIVRMNQKGDAATKNLLKALYNYHLAAEALQTTV